MLVVIAVFITTWMSLSFLIYVIGGFDTFREVSNSAPMFYTMLLVGWVPPMIVGSDCYENLYKGE